MSQPSPSLHRRAGRQSGIALLEVSLGLAGLVVLSLVLLLISIRSIQAQRWTIMQTFSDAFLSREVALAKRTPFADLTAAGSPWPAAPRRNSQQVTLGRLPSGLPVTATLWRFREPAGNNLPAAGGAGTTVTNPVSLEGWRFSSGLTYSIGERNYVKARNVIRTR